MAHFIHTGESSLNVILEYSRNVANGRPEQNPINGAIDYIQTNCEKLSREIGKVRAKAEYHVFPSFIWLIDNQYYNWHWLATL